MELLLNWFTRPFRWKPSSVLPADMADSTEDASVSVSLSAESETPGSVLDLTMPGDVRADLAEAMAQYGSKSPAAYEDDTDDRETEVLPIIRLANTIIQQALKAPASDIHIEPDPRGLRVRYRIDGTLHETMQMPSYIVTPLTRRFQVMAEMDLMTHRGLPQQGRIGIRYNGNDYDLFVSSLPTRYGDRLTMQIYGRSQIRQDLHALGFTAEIENQFWGLAQQSTGMLLVCGSSAAHRKTTLYTLLDKLNSIEKHLLSVEEIRTYDPRGVTQIALCATPGLTLQMALDTARRQGTDILLIDELRNREMALTTLDASETLFVLSALNAKEGPSALLRLISMGLEPALVAHSVRGVLAQCLVRRVCEQCKETYEAPASELMGLGYQAEDPDQTVILARGIGCTSCYHTGYRGQIGLFSLLQMNASLAQLLETRPSQFELERAAQSNGMQSLRKEGLARVLQGVTTPDEVLRSVQNIV